jgi:hypothetical protein
MRRFFLVVLIAMILTIPSAIVVAGGPAEKATGSIGIYEPWDGGHRKVSFNAHEASGNRPAKGNMIDMVFGPDGNLRRKFQYDVVYVHVEDNWARFGAYCIYDSGGVKTGDWLYVKVEDGGTPGTAGDYIGWKWGTETQVENWVNNGGNTGWWRLAISGNLAVHT